MPMALKKGEPREPISVVPVAGVGTVLKNGVGGPSPLGLVSAAIPAAAASAAAPGVGEARDPPGRESTLRPRKQIRGGRLKETV